MNKHLIDVLDYFQWVAPAFDVDALKSVSNSLDLVMIASIISLKHASFHLDKRHL